MIKRFAMTLDKFIICIAIILLIGCKEDDGYLHEDIIYDYKCRAAEDLVSYTNNGFDKKDTTLICSDLSLVVTSRAKEPNDSSLSGRPVNRGDLYVKKQLEKFFETQSVSTRTVLETYEYRLDPCIGIKILLYDANDNFVKDMTDQARFMVRTWQPRVIINTSKELLGIQREGMTIREYLEMNPMVFAEADFMFEDFDRKLVFEGYYFKTEVELEDTVLQSKSIFKKWPLQVF